MDSRFPDDLPSPSWLRKRLVTPDIQAFIEQVPKPVGSLNYDPFGYNADTAAMYMGLMRYLYQYYFRVSAHGLENVPKHGRVLVIANHSGQIPMDGALIAYALTTNPHGPRLPRGMMERFLPMVPYLGNMINEGGTVLGDVENCKRMLQREEAILVFPEGVRGTGKTFDKRYRLQRFGTGFMHLALETNTPILPVGVVGCEESLPSLGNIKPLARLLNIPYVPICPPLVLPTKVILNFGEPLHFSGNDFSANAIDDKVEQVKDAIRDLLQQGLAQRKGWFS